MIGPTITTLPKTGFRRKVTLLIDVDTQRRQTTTHFLCTQVPSNVWTEIISHRMPVYLICIR